MKPLFLFGVLLCLSSISFAKTHLYYGNINFYTNASRYCAETESLLKQLSSPSLQVTVYEHCQLKHGGRENPWFIRQIKPVVPQRPAVDYLSLAVVFRVKEKAFNYEDGPRSTSLSMTSQQCDEGQTLITAVHIFAEKTSLSAGCDEQKNFTAKLVKLQE